MTCLYVVVAKGLGVVLQVVDNLCGDIRLVSLDKISLVAGGLSLQNVAILQQDDVVAIALALALEVGADTCHCPLHGTALGEVVRKESSVHIGGFYQSDSHSFSFGHHGHINTNECEDDNRLFHKYNCV